MLFRSAVAQCRVRGWRGWRGHHSRSVGTRVVDTGRAAASSRLTLPDTPAVLSASNTICGAMTLMTERPGDLADLEAHPTFRLAAPSPDHLLPLAYTAGLAAAAGTTAEVLLAGYSYGSLSMTSYVVR